MAPPSTRDRKTDGRAGALGRRRTRGARYQEGRDSDDQRQLGDAHSPAPCSDRFRPVFLNFRPWCRVGVMSTKVARGSAGQALTVSPRRGFGLSWSRGGSSTLGQRAEHRLDYACAADGGGQDREAGAGGNTGEARSSRHPSCLLGGDQVAVGNIRFLDKRECPFLGRAGNSVGPKASGFWPPPAPPNTTPTAAQTRSRTGGGREALRSRRCPVA